MLYKPDSNTTWRKRKILFLFLIPIFLLAVAFIVMLLWNAILPDIIHVGAINYLQALGLLILSRILFGGFGHGRDGHRHHFAKARALREKWGAMSDEEKQKFKEEWRSRCEHRND
jgi:Ca2+/H+ antiporter, TMEM165/GDT1 family